MWEGVETIGRVVTKNETFGNWGWGLLSIAIAVAMGIAIVELNVPR